MYGKLEELLLEAAEAMNPELLAECIDTGANVNCRNECGRTALSFLCARSESSSLQSDGRTPERRRVQTAELLLRSGANVEQEFYVSESTNAWMRPLQAAVYFRLDALTELLLEHGCEVNATAAAGGFTALHWAVYRMTSGCGDADVRRVERLLGVEGVDVNAKCSSSGNTPLHIAVTRELASDAIRLLRAHGADAGARNASGRDVAQEYMASVRRLRTSRGCFRGIEPRLFELLAPLGRSDTSPLHLASIFHATAQLSRLLSAAGTTEREVNARDGFGYTALQYAVLSRGPAEPRSAAVRLLLSHGADVYKTLDGGGGGGAEGDYSVLDLAILLDDRDVCRILLQHVAKLVQTRYASRRDEGVAYCEVIGGYMDLVYWTTEQGEKSELWKYFVSCLGELGEMKSRKVAGSELSLFQLLTADARTSRTLARNRRLVRAFENAIDDELLFPIYRESVAHTTFGRNVENRRLRESAAVLLSDTLRFADHTHIFYEKTLSHLDSEDLRFLLAAAES